MKTFSALLGLVFLLAINLPAVYAQSSGVVQSQPTGIQGQPAGVPENYILSPMDIVLVKIFEQPDLDSQYRISQDGTINFPLIGLVRISGETVSQAANTIRDSLMIGYLRNPQVRVNVIHYAKRRFTVLGQGQRPGSYVLPEEEHVDLLQAIA